jgi:acetyl-CoA carboxylase, biotin carboxylase subunit
VAGGGGKGMKIVTSSSDFTSAFRRSKAEAKSAFGDDRVYLEKYLKDPRHVEVQILADEKGNIINIGERECSIQRRHQKLVEESPANFLSDKLRAGLHDAAIEIARGGNYSSAGTAEFLIDEDENFYFLEMNTRLQVEHPVTEFLSGIDIVREQIEIACGAPLKYRQKDILLRGHAIECRICAEDPCDNFFPSTGTIMSIVTGGGIGIREDRGVEEGSEITPYYDSLISKLIAWGRDRDEAIKRMERAIGEYRLFGLKSNLGLLDWIVRHPKFRKGKYTTTFLDSYFDPSQLSMQSDEETRIAALFTVLSQSAGRDSDGKKTNPMKSGWLKKRMHGLR